MRIGDAMLDNLRRQYFETVLAVTTDEEVYAILPNKAFSNYSEVMKGIIDLLMSEIKDTMSMLSKESDEELIELYKEELTQLNKKLKICEQVLRESFLIEEDDKKIVSSKKKTVIFGLSPAGNVAFLSDLKRYVDEHYYSTVMELLNSLIDGTLPNNTENMRQFTSTNNKLHGLYEAKAFQIRILFQPIGKDILYISMVRVKKDDNTSKDLNEPIKRCSLLSKDFETVKRIVKSGEGLEQLLIENEEILQDIKDFVDSKKDRKMKDAKRA